MGIYPAHFCINEVIGYDTCVLIGDPYGLKAAVKKLGQLSDLDICGHVVFLMTTHNL